MAGWCALLLFVAASVEAFPMEPEDVVLIDASKPVLKKDAHQKFLAGRVQVAKQKVEAAKARLHGAPPVSDSYVTSTTTSAASSSAADAAVSVGHTGKRAAIAEVTALGKTSPTTQSEKKYINHPPPGTKGFRKGRASTAIRQANWEIKHIEHKVADAYDFKSLKADGARKLKEASRAAAQAEANMATEVRGQAERRATKIVLKVNGLRAKLRKAHGKRKAKLQMALAKADADKKTVFAAAMRAGMAATTAISKAAKVMGTAVGLDKLKQDGPNALLAAVAAHNRAKADLSLFEQNQKIKHGYESSDAKRKAYFNKLQEENRKRMAAAMAAYDRNNNRDRVATYAAASTAAPVATHTHVSAAPIPATHAAATAAAAEAVAKAHTTGKASDAKAARKAVTTAMKTPMKKVKKASKKPKKP